MPDSEKIKAFADMVDGIERLTKPIQEENMRLHDQIDKMRTDRKHERIIYCIIIVLLSLALTVFMALAYLSPVEVEQGQNYESQTQNQSYREGSANGD